MIIPVILSGGSGTRLWPLSRETYPKQFLPLVDERTMVQNTALRIVGMSDATAPMVVCNEDHRFMVAEQLRAIGIHPAAVACHWHPSGGGDSGTDWPQYRASSRDCSVARPECGR